jgi:hypothetical protein
MKQPSHDKLYKEAAIVGVALVPMWYAVARFTAAVQLGGSHKALIDVALAGALFHLAAEESGLNTYYLTNSYAHEKAFAAEFKENETCVGSDVDRLRSVGNVFGL